MLEIRTCPHYVGGCGSTLLVGVANVCGCFVLVLFLVKRNWTSFSNDGQKSGCSCKVFSFFLCLQFEEWNAHSRLTLAYIKTRSKPPVFYLPTQHNESTWRCLAQSQTETEGQQHSSLPVCCCMLMRTWIVTSARYYGLLLHVE